MQLVIARRFLPKSRFLVPHFESRKLAESPALWDPAMLRDPGKRDWEAGDPAYERDPKGGAICHLLCVANDRLLRLDKRRRDSQ